MNEIHGKSYFRYFEYSGCDGGQQGVAVMWKLTIRSICGYGPASASTCPDEGPQERPSSFVSVVIVHIVAVFLCFFVLVLDVFDCVASEYFCVCSRFTFHCGRFASFGMI